MSIGFVLPFSKSTGSIGFFEATNDPLTAVEQNLRSLLLTNWGERVCHYNFGCNFREFLFENVSNDELKSRIAERIIGQVETWLPYVRIDVLNIFTSIDDTNLPEAAIRVSIVFSLSSRPDLRSRFDQVIGG